MSAFQCQCSLRSWLRWDTLPCWEQHLVYHLREVSLEPLISWFDEIVVKWSVERMWRLSVWYQAVHICVGDCLSHFSTVLGQFFCGAHVKMPINIVLPIQNYPTCCNSIANEQASLIGPLKNGNIKTPYFRVPFAGAQHYSKKRFQNS